MCQPQHPPPEAEKSAKGVSEIIEELVVALATFRIYPPSHPRVTAALASLTTGLEDVLQRLDTDALRLGMADGYIFVDGRPLLGASLSASRLIQPLRAVGSGGLELSRGAREKDFLVILKFLNDAPEDLALHAANETLKRAGSTSITLLPPFKRSRGRNNQLDTMSATLGKAQATSESEGLLAQSIPIRLYQDIVDHLQGSMVNACKGEGIDMRGARDYVEAILRRIVSEPKSMLSISRYEQYDAFTFGHSIRVCLLAVCFARSLNLAPDLQERIGLASLMHDIGKSRVPFEILHSKGRLSGVERMEMNRHTLHGAEILLEAEESDPMAVVAAFGHHRAASGGYPRTLYDADLSTGTKIIKICDVYEALTAVRPYKDRMSPVRAYRIMMSMGDHFDQAMLRRFIHTTGVYPIGSRVRLTTGEIGRVHKQSEMLECPVVDIEQDPDGQVYHKDARRRVDLSRYGMKGELAVEEALLAAELS